MAFAIQGAPLLFFIPALGRKTAEKIVQSVTGAAIQQTFQHTFPEPRGRIGGNGRCTVLIVRKEGGYPVVGIEKSHQAAVAAHVATLVQRDAVQRGDLGAVAADQDVAIGAHRLGDGEVAAVDGDVAGRVTEVQVKRKGARSHWVWGAFKMPARVLGELFDLWQERQRCDEYIGTLVNAYLERGGRASGVRAGARYVDVGTLAGYREATRLLNEESDWRSVCTAHSGSTQ